MVQIHVRAPISNALVPQQLQGGFRKPVFVGASPTRGPILRSEPTTSRIRVEDVLRSLWAKEDLCSNWLRATDGGPVLMVIMM